MRRFGRSILFFVLVIGWSHAGVPPFISDAQPVSLHCEYLKNPLGVEARHPRLSWQIESKTRGQLQSGYQILVAGTEAAIREDRGDLWDTGRVDSDRSLFVSYEGTTLKTGQLCFWKVRVWDKEGNVSAWSETMLWRMGLLHPSDWTAKWIGKDETEDHPVIKGSNWIWYPEDKPAAALRFFRRIVELPQDRAIKSANLLVAADNVATVFLNGVSLGSASFANLVSQFDVSASLVPGPNVLSISVENTGTAPNPAGLMLLLRIEFDSGPPLVVASDESWRAALSESPNWKELEYDDSSWPKARVLGEAGMSPWGETYEQVDRDLPARMVRTQFSIERPVRRAYVSFSGLGLSELYLNGSKVGDDVLSPGLTDYSRRVLYVTYDVTKSIRQGDNAVGVILGNGRYFAPRLYSPMATVTYGYPKLLFQLHVDYVDGSSTVELVSDESWRLTTLGPIRKNNEYDGEDYDARMEMDGWSLPGFDDSDWEKMRIVEAPGGVLASQKNQPIRVVSTMEPSQINEVRPGVYVVDMGQNIVGWCRIKVLGKAGDKVSLRFAESLQSDGSIYTANLRSARATDHYTLRGGTEEIWEPRFTYHGFRYVEVSGWPGKLTRENILGCVVNDDLEIAGDFSCSEDMINRIYRNVVWGVQGNYRSIPTDCPQRDERQGWLGDRAEFARGETYLFNVNALYAKWTQDILDAQKESGSLPDVAPPYWPVYKDDVSWPSAAIFIPAALLDQYDDVGLIHQRYAGMVRWVDYMSGFIDAGFLGRDYYGDWCVPPEDPAMIHSLDPARQTDPEIIATSYFYHGLTLMTRFADLVGNPKDSGRFHASAATLKEAFHRKFYDPVRGCYGNGSQTASVLPLAFDMVPPDQRSRVYDHLVDSIVEGTAGHIGTGLIGGQWLNRTLSDGGYGDLSYRLSTNVTYPGWGYMVAQGATTIWELWNGDTADPAMNSGNHVMLVGDLITWLYEDVAGIRSDPRTPGFKHILMRPQPVGDLRWARASHESPYGLVVSDWKIHEDRFRWSVTIPPNTTATLWIPCDSPELIHEGASSLPASPWVRIVKVEGGLTVCSISSGQFWFECPWKNNVPPPSASADADGSTKVRGRSVEGNIIKP